MLTVCANIGLFPFFFSITSLDPLLFTPPPPLIPIYHQPSHIENVFITSCIMNQVEPMHYMASLLTFINPLVLNGDSLGTSVSFGTHLRF